MRLDSLCTYTAENLELLDTPVHIHIHIYIYIYARTCGVYAQIQDYNDGTHCKRTTNYGFTHVSFVQNVAHVRIFSSRAGLVNF